jgi:hypothetical protein
MAALAAPSIAADVTPTNKAYDHHDLSGFWDPTDWPFKDVKHFADMVHANDPDAKGPFPEMSSVPNGHPSMPIHYTPEFEALQKKIQTDYDAGRPYRTGYMCKPPGLWATIGWAGTIQIFRSPGRFLFQRGLISYIFTVYLDRPHKTDFAESGLYGDSVGHWEGDTLVIDTVNLGGAMVLSETEPHSQSLHIIQRVTRPTYDTLVDVMTAEDPRAFKKPWTVEVRYKLTNDEFDEIQCDADGGGKPMAVAPD